MIVLDVETIKLENEQTKEIDESVTGISAIHLFQPPKECIFKPQKEFYEELRVLGKGEHEARHPERKHPEKAIKEFAAWLQDIPDQTSVGIVINQHLDSLRKLSEKYNLQVFNPRIRLDIREVCYTVMSINGHETPKTLTLDKIIEYAGLEKTPKPCNTIEQARLEAEILSRLLYKKSLYKKYCQEQFPVPEYLK